MIKTNKLFRITFVKLSVGLLLLFVLLILIYDSILIQITTTFRDTALGKLVCNGQTSAAYDVNVRESLMLVNDQCIVSGPVRFLVSDFSLIVLYLLLSWVFVKVTLLPIERLTKAQERFTNFALHQMLTPLSVMHASLDNAIVSKKFSKQSVKDIKNELKVLESTTRSLVSIGDINTEKSNTEKVLEIAKLYAKRYNVSLAHDSIESIQKFELPVAEADLRTVIDIALNNVSRYSKDNTATIGIHRNFFFVTITLNNIVSFNPVRGGSGIGVMIAEMIGNKYGGRCTLRIKNNTASFRFSIRRWMVRK